MYDEFGKLAGIAATIIVAGIIIYQLAINVLPWLLLVAAVCGGLYFLYWYFISSRRSEHPWTH
jgi:O-antigen/teichoic acid export membrane protein